MGKEVQVRGCVFGVATGKITEGAAQQNARLLGQPGRASVDLRV